MSDKIKHPVTDLLGETIQKVKEMVDSNTVVGAPIELPNGTVVLPVSKISVGLASGGSDISSKSAKELFGGGSGAGVTVTPVAFLVCKKDGDVRVINVNAKGGSSIDKIIDIVPNMVDKVTSFIPNTNDKENVEDKE